MKKICVLFLFCLLIACEDKKATEKPASTTTKIDTQQNKVTEDSKTTEKKTEPEKEEEKIVLNAKNAIPFFKEYGQKNPENKVRITTSFGVIDILLFDKTPYHKANFVFLTKQNYFEGAQFHRVVKDFIIQGGNSDSWSIAKKRQAIGKYLLPPDTRKGIRHDRGIVSMPSSEIENPHKLASPYEFFIVQQKGGAHHLNGKYTAFGKVISGMDVVDKICDVPTDTAEWPIQNVYIKKVEIIK